MKPFIIAKAVIWALIVTADTDLLVRVKQDFPGLGKLSMV